LFQKEIPVRLWIQKGFFMEIGKKIRELRMRKGLPLGEKSFNGIRRQFYYLLAKEKRIV